MKRGIIAALLILVAVFICGSLHSNTIKKVSKESNEVLASISKMLNKKDYSSARNEFYKYQKNWEKKKAELAILITHEDIDDITRKNARLSACFNNEAETEAFAIIGELNELFSELDYKFRINFKNILQIRGVFI